MLRKMPKNQKKPSKKGDRGEGSGPQNAPYTHHWPLQKGCKRRGLMGGIEDAVPCPYKVKRVEKPITTDRKRVLEESDAYIAQECGGSGGSAYGKALTADFSRCLANAPITQECCGGGDSANGKALTADFPRRSVDIPSNAKGKKLAVLQVKIPAWNEENQRFQKLAVESDNKCQEAKMIEEQKIKEMINDAWEKFSVVEDIFYQALKDTAQKNVITAREAMRFLDKTLVRLIAKNNGGIARENLAEIQRKVGFLATWIKKNKLGDFVKKSMC